MLALLWNELEPMRVAGLEEHSPIPHRPILHSAVSNAIPSCEYGHCKPDGQVHVNLNGSLQRLDFHQDSIDLQFHGPQSETLFVIQENDCHCQVFQVPSIHVALLVG